MSGAGTGLALVGAYLLAAARLGPEAGIAAYERRMRSFVEANQEIGRLHVHTRDAVEPSPDFESEWFTDLPGGAINGVELPDYAELRDSGSPTG